MKHYGVMFAVIILISRFAYADYESLPDVETLSSRQTWNNQTHARDNQMLQWLKKMDALQQEVQELRGKVEEQDYLVQQLRKDHDSEVLMLRQQINQLSAAGLSKPKQTGGITYTPEPTSSIKDSMNISHNTVKKVSSEESLYQDAYQKLQGKSYLEAKQTFQSLIAQYPNSQYVANSYYWLGEINLVEGRLEEARVAFQNVIDKHSAHPKAGDALLKLGNIAQMRSDWTLARTLYQKVQYQFPNSASARLAHNKLQEMQNAGA